MGFSLREELSLSDPDKKALPEYDHLYLARVLRREVSQGTMVQKKKDYRLKSSATCVRLRQIICQFKNMLESQYDPEP